METLDSSRGRSCAQSSPRAKNRDYAVVASELLVDRLAGLRVRARAVRPAAPRSRRSPGTFAGTLREGRALGLPGPGGRFARAALGTKLRPGPGSFGAESWATALWTPPAGRLGSPARSPSPCPWRRSAPELAPALWLLLVRAAGLLSLVLAARLAARLARAAGTSSAASNATAGALAAALLALSPGWWRYLAHGNEVPAGAGARTRRHRAPPERPPARRLRAIALVLLLRQRRRRSRRRTAPGCGRQPAARPLMIGIAAGCSRYGSCRSGPVPATRSAPSAKRGPTILEPGRRRPPWRAALGRAHSLAGPVVEAGLVTALILRLRGSLGSACRLHPACRSRARGRHDASRPFGQRALLRAAAGGRLRRRRRRPVGPVPPSADSPLRCSRRPGPCNPAQAAHLPSSCARSGPSSLHAGLERPRQRCRQ